MLFYAVSVFSVVAFGFSATAEFTLPVTTCKRNSADYSACLKRALEEAWPRFIQGLPEYDFPSLDPVLIKHGKIFLTANELHGEVTGSNITAIGLAKTRFFDVRTHFLDDVFRLELDTQVPKVFGKGAVKMDGAVNVFRILGNGHFNVTATDIRGTWTFIGHVVNDTWIVEHFLFLPTVGSLKIYFDLLAEQSKELNDLVVSFVNEYWPPLYRIALPIMADFWDPWLVKNIANKFFSKVSFSELFP
ncbi:uncharacterized protein LOC112455421 [Temnothorax curvispinosus]|uniref:Uncharacterized protein LOC112455421 n=1 Tax=Temnothorax curvispinosus TaxID=300111 RepID=A0A6J1PTD0_9HYME|nr:uncharacterized protein LOC112455421 [Temnothorax curvispinosus]